MAENDSAYLICLKTESIYTRQEVTPWLKERDAVHVLNDVWFMKSHYRMAGDIAHELSRFRGISGRLLVIKLDRNWTDCAHEGLSEEADSWIRANLWSEEGP